MSGLFPSLKQRSEKKERMDLEVLSYEEVRETYRLIGYVNRYLGGRQVILHHLENFSKNWLDTSRGTSLRILDAASGGGDIPFAILRWARAKGWKVEVTVLDINPETLRYAREQRKRDPTQGLNFICASVFELPFAEKSFDYVISSMFFHHLSHPEMVRVLRIFDSLALKGIIINDLVRSRAAYYGILFLVQWTLNPYFRHDAPLSVLRGFQKKEILDLIRDSRLDYLKFYSHCPYRFAIAGEKR